MERWWRVRDKDMEDGDPFLFTFVDGCRLSRSQDGPLSILYISLFLSERALDEIETESFASFIKQRHYIFSSIPLHRHLTTDFHTTHERRHQRFVPPPPIGPGTVSDWSSFLLFSRGRLRPDSSYRLPPPLHTGYQENNYSFWDFNGQRTTPLII